MESLAQDVRFSLRLLCKSPGFAIAAVVTLALAISANAVVFGVLNALILRPLNVPNPDSLYGIETGDSALGYQSYLDYLDFRDRNHSFDALATYTVTKVVLDTGKNPSRSWAYETSGNYFDVLGIQPYLGRFFHSSDEHGPDSAPYIVLSYAYWHSRFLDDPGVVGRVVQVNRNPFTIIGVAPPGFYGTLLFFAADFFVPMVNHKQLTGRDSLTTRRSRWTFPAMGRLKPGVTPTQALTDLTSIGAYLEATYPKEVEHKTFSLIRPDLPSSLGRSLQAFAGGLMLLTGMILLAACANLGILFAARAADRSREVALRLALGASRTCIVRQLLTETVLISLIGGTLGLLGSVALLNRLSTWRPFPVPLHLSVAPDAKVYVAALILALVSGFLLGILPTRQVLSASPYEIIKAGAAGRFGRRLTLRDALLVMQVAICAVLVMSSMVAVRGLVRSLRSDLGFTPQNVMLVDADLNMAGYSADAVWAVQRRMIDAMETLPGVEHVGLVNLPPLGPGGSGVTSVFKDETADLRPSNVAAARVYVYNISPGYVHAAATTLLAGRTLSWRDDKNAPSVAVVNRQFAARVLGSVPNVVGRYYKLPNGNRIQVVGVVEDGKYVSLTEEQHPAVFRPILQQPPLREMWLVVRSTRDPEQLAAAMRSKLRELDAGLPFEIKTWNAELDLALFPSRVATVALGVLGMMAAMLAIAGIFGMASYSVSQRLRELGIRIAIGADRGQVIQAALARAVKLLAVGSAAGLFLGILSSRVLALIVYQATPYDPLVLGGVVLAMLLLGLLATWIPAQRALSINPVVLLRDQ
ncbi:MAG: ABC transporter permease [Vicinamibacterales bacterium]